MAIAISRVTAQGQISVPADVRRKLGIGPGSVLEWDEDDGKIVVRRAGRFTSEDSIAWHSMARNRKRERLRS